MSNALQDIANANRKNMLERLMCLSQTEMEMEMEDLSAPGRRLLEEEVVLKVGGQELNMTLEQN